MCKIASIAANRWSIRIWIWKRSSNESSRRAIADAWNRQNSNNSWLRRRKEEIWFVHLFWGEILSNEWLFFCDRLDPRRGVLCKQRVSCLHRISIKARSCDSSASLVRAATGPKREPKEKDRPSDGLKPRWEAMPD